MEKRIVKELVGKIEGAAESKLAQEEMIYRVLMQEHGFSYRTSRALVKMNVNSDLTEEETAYLFQPDLYKDAAAMAKFVRFGLEELVPEDMFMNEEFLQEAEITELPAHFVDGLKTSYSFTVRGEIKSIGAHAFEGCAELTEVEIKDGLQEIGRDAFRGSGLREIQLPGTVKRIAAGAFRDCGHLTEVRLPKEFKRIESDVFNGCGWLRDMNLPSDIYAGDRAFKNCMELRFPNTLSVESLGEESFYGCAELRKIIIDTQTVSKNAFLGCLNLTTVIFQEIPDELCEGSFLFCRSLSLITIAGFEHDIYSVKGLPELMRNASPIVKNVMSMEIKAGKDVHQTLSSIVA